MEQISKKYENITRYLLTLFFILLTIKTFVVEATWFDYVWALFILIYLSFFLFRSIIERKKIYAIILALLFLANLFWLMGDVMNSSQVLSRSLAEVTL
ncbi:hypothetical protein HF072_05155 [Bacillus sp. RO3]|nr:hypothetical protein [Bacillus sp. RO3]